MVCYQAKGAVGLLSGYFLGFRRLVCKEWLVFVREDRSDKISGSEVPGGLSAKAPATSPLPLGQLLSPFGNTSHWISFLNGPVRLAMWPSSPAFL
jgi:hypothetical protein